jgi:gluconolactonase
VIRVNRHGDTTVLADRYDGRRLNSPNDLVHASDGTLYFTDPPFGLPDESERELPFSGVYRVRDGEIAVVTDELKGPNGIALSPDEHWLYVGDWDPDHKAVMRYDLATGHGELFCDLTGEPGEDAIDGIKVDPDGNLFVCGPGGIWVLSPDGERLGLIVLPEDPHNLAWGGDGALYITASTSIYRLQGDPR